MPDGALWFRWFGIHHFSKEILIAVLTYHVVPSKVMAADVVKLTEAPTVQGSKVKVKVEGGTVMIDSAKVVKTDI
ncbi:MAG: hypothetical protein DWI25_02130, partial [Planctomycetota bacterium]